MNKKNGPWTISAYLRHSIQRQHELLELDTEFNEAVIKELLIFHNRSLILLRLLLFLVDKL